MDEGSILGFVCLLAHNREQVFPPSGCHNLANNFSNRVDIEVPIFSQVPLKCNEHTLPVGFHADFLAAVVHSSHFVASRHTFALSITMTLMNPMMTLNSSNLPQTF